MAGSIEKRGKNSYNPAERVQPPKARKPNKTLILKME